MDSTFRTIRIVYVAMLLAAIVYVFLPELVHARTRSLDSTLVVVFIVLACWLVATAFILRKRMIIRAENVLVNTPEDAAALKRWRAGNLAVFMVCESIVLYGLVLRFIGAPVGECAIFYAAGIALFLLFRPRRPA